MFELITRQGDMFLLSVLIGILMGLTYDFFRILRRIISHNILMIDFQDIFYWISWMIIVIYFIQEYNSGSLRIYIVVGILLGTILYECTVSRFIMMLTQKIVSVGNKILKKINKLLKYITKRVKININYKKMSKD